MYKDRTECMDSLWQHRISSIPRVTDPRMIHVQKIDIINPNLAINRGQENSTHEVDLCGQVKPSSVTDAVSPHVLSVHNDCRGIPVEVRRSKRSHVRKAHVMVVAFGGRLYGCVQRACITSRIYCDEFGRKCSMAIFFFVASFRSLRFSFGAVLISSVFSFKVSFQQHLTSSPGMVLHVHQTNVKHLLIICLPNGSIDGILPKHDVIWPVNWAVKRDSHTQGMMTSEAFYVLYARVEIRAIS